MVLKISANLNSYSTLVTDIGHGDFFVLVIAVVLYSETCLKIK